MSGYRVLDAAGHRIDEIYLYTLERWGEAQADAYVHELFARFAAIAARDFAWRAIPAAFGIDGYVCRHERHFIYWRLLSDGDVGIVTVLHERMHQAARFAEDAGG